MSDFVNTPLEKLFNRRNIVSRLERVERRTFVPPMTNITRFSKITDDTNLNNTTWQCLYEAEARGMGAGGRALTFDNIPDNGKSIEIFLLARSHASTDFDTVTIGFDGDVSNTYVGGYQYGGPTPNWTQQTAAGAPTVCANITGDTGTSGWMSIARIEIPYYAGTTFKLWMTTLNILTTVSGGNIWMYNAGGLWLSTNPITSVQLACANGFTTTSRALLKVYG